MRDILTNRTFWCIHWLTCSVFGAADLHFGSSIVAISEGGFSRYSSLLCSALDRRFKPRWRHAPRLIKVVWPQEYCTIWCHYYRCIGGMGLLFISSMLLICSLLYRHWEQQASASYLQALLHLLRLSPLNIIAGSGIIDGFRMIGGALLVAISRDFWGLS